MGSYVSYVVPIYGEIELPRFLKSLIDSKILRRLQFIRQLSAVWVKHFGAQGTRLEHCLGVAYLTWHFLNRSDVKSVITEAVKDLINKFSVSDLLRKYISTEDTQDLIDVIVDKIINQLTILALIHDVFHTMWGHALEYYINDLLTQFKEALQLGNSYVHVDKLFLFLVVLDPKIIDITEHISISELKPVREFRYELFRSLNLTKFERIILILGTSYLVSESKDLQKELLEKLLSRFKLTDSEKERLFNFFLALSEHVIRPLVKFSLNDKILDLDRLDYVNRDAFHAFGYIKVPWKDILRNISIKYSDKGLKFTIPDSLKPLIYEYYYSRLDNYVRLYENPDIIGLKELIVHMTFAITQYELRTVMTIDELLQLFFGTDESFILECQDKIEEMLKGDEKTRALGYYVKFLLNKLITGSLPECLILDRKYHIRNFEDKIKLEMYYTLKILQKDDLKQAIVKEIEFTPRDLELLCKIQHRFGYGFPLIFVRSLTYCDGPRICSDVLTLDNEEPLCLTIDYPQTLCNTVLVIPFSEELSEKIKNELLKGEHA